MTLRSRRLAVSLFVPICFLAVAEIVLRMAGYPTGRYAPLYPADRGVYPENARLAMDWGPIPYTIRTNSLGLRGPEIVVPKDAETERIVAIGDSFTDGYFVDDEATWEVVLQKNLGHRTGRDVEVVNAAWGGGSIDKELALLREIALPLDPDTVILQFFCNDITDLRGRPLDELLRYTLKVQRPGLVQRVQKFLVTRSALGEALFSRAMDRRREENVSPSDGLSRYAFAGAGDTATNLRLYREQFKTRDMEVLSEPWTDEIEELMKLYVTLLDRFIQECDRNGIALVFVYFPSYGETHGEGSGYRVNSALQEACRERKIPFLDLSPVFRRESQDTNLYLMPLDSHLNLEGHRVAARELGEYLSSPRAGLQSGRMTP